VNSAAADLSLLSPEELKAHIETLTEREALELLYDWQGTWARENQRLPKTDPENPWSVLLALAGRGYGKTRVGTEGVRTWVEEWKESGKGNFEILRIAMIAETSADARDVLVEGESGILAVSPPWFSPDYEPSKRRLTWRVRTGKEGKGKKVAMATLYAGNEPDQLRGPQHHKGLVDELAKYQYAEETWDNYQMGLRLGTEPQTLVTTTPRPLEILLDIMNDPDTRVVTGSTYENIANLSPTFIKKVVRKYEGTRLGDQELHAKILMDTPGALITQKTIDKNRIDYKAGMGMKFKFIIISLDPSATSGEDADEFGITIDDHAYLIKDDSDILTPEEWSRRAIMHYVNYGASCIVAERNNGGEMIQTILNQADVNIKPTVELVWASEGKDARAEEPALLYEQGRVHHIGHFAMLENELRTYVRPGSTPSKSKTKKLKSPNRGDSWMWAIWKLMLAGGGAGETAADFITYRR